MTGKNLFECQGYKAYLRHQLDAKGARSGLRGDFAKALRCQSSFVSQVLHGSMDLSLEQAFRANDFFEHDTPHAHFFMLLVQKDRAATSELRDYFQNQLDRILDERSKIKSRVATTHELSDADKAQYYSSWDFVAVHMALAVPGQRTSQELSAALSLPLRRVENVLEKLLELGMAERNGREFRIGSVHLHLGSDSPFVQQHHTNWRLEGLRRLNVSQTQNLHYSAVYSLSKKDYMKLRENLLQVIQDNLAVVRPSPEEITIAQTIDLYPLSPAL